MILKFEQLAEGITNIEFSLSFWEFSQIPVSKNTHRWLPASWKKLLKNAKNTRELNERWRRQYATWDEKSSMENEERKRLSLSRGKSGDEQSALGQLAPMMLSQLYSMDELIRLDWLSDDREKKWVNRVWIGYCRVIGSEPEYSNLVFAELTGHPLDGIRLAEELLCDDKANPGVRPVRQPRRLPCQSFLPTQTSSVCVSPIPTLSRRSEQTLLLLFAGSRQIYIFYMGGLNF